MEINGYYLPSMRFKISVILRRDITLCLERVKLLEGGTSSMIDSDKEFQPDRQDFNSPFNLYNQKA